MTREVKFRAWLTHRNSFYVYGPEATSTLLSKPRGFDVVIEQYTGINDMDGVEIYENDIVIAMPMIPGDEQYTDAVPMGVVKYDEGAYFIFGSNNAIRLFQETILISVVGNIHQNLELLEGS